MFDVFGGGGGGKHFRVLFLLAVVVAGVKVCLWLLLSVEALGEVRFIVLSPFSFEISFITVFAKLIFF